MPALEDLISEAIAAGKVRRVPEGMRSLEQIGRERRAPQQRPEACGCGHQVAPIPGADDMRY